MTLPCGQETGTNMTELRENAGEATRLLKALANVNRLMILCMLDGIEMSVGQLNESLDLSQSALSQHLAVLRRDGLVKTRRDAQTIFYSLADPVTSEIVGVLHRRFCS
ncbi:ArsR/SmtB family transcription factor [Pelagibaculum spongiae]|nr:metalloregulator ArsR/SmtB family transcription factor [Pelagibaculum spongiae]